MKQGQDLGRATADVFVRLLGRSPSWLPRRARMRHGLKGASFVLAPDRQPKLRAKRVGLLDQLFFAAASGSLTRTTPCLRWRIPPPVSHQVRLFCQLSPASCRVRQIVWGLTLGSPSGAWRKARCSRLKDQGAVPSCSRWRARAPSARRRCCASAPEQIRAPPPCPGRTAASPSRLKRLTQAERVSLCRRPTWWAAAVEVAP